MGGWRGKFILLLVVYFAGFATAIYSLAPETNEHAGAEVEAGSWNNFSELKSEEFTKSFNTGIHKCLDFSKEAALQVAKLVKEKYEQKSLTDG